MGRPKRGGGGREAGVTLLEVLIVVAILGLISVIMTVAVSNALKRERLKSAANQLGGFIENAFVRAQSSASGIILAGVTNADGSCTFSLYTDSNNDGVFNSGDQLVRTQLVPADIVVQGLNSGGSTFGAMTWPSTGSGSGTTLLLYCDSMGRTLNPTAAAVSTTPATPAGPNVQLMGPSVLSVTHTDMVNGDLRPHLRYDMTVYPIWHAVAVEERY